MSALLSTRQLRLAVGDRTLCDDFSLEIEPGQCWALLGRNGTGKTSLLHCLAGIRPADGGTVWVAGRRIDHLGAKQRARRIGLLLQHSEPGFGAGVFDTVLSGRFPYLSPLVRESAEDEALARRALRDLDLENLSERPLTRLSGGELRRVEIARLLAQQAPITLLDEPTNHLDLAHQASCIQVLLSQCVTPGRAMLMAVHDLNLAYRACDRWLILDGSGRWWSGDRAALADPGLLRRAFGYPIDVVDGPDGPLFHTTLLTARRPC